MRRRDVLRGAIAGLLTAAMPRALMPQEEPTRTWEERDPEARKAWEELIHMAETDGYYVTVWSTNTVVTVVTDP